MLMLIKQYLNEIKNRIFLISLFYTIFLVFLYYYKDILLKLNILSNNKFHYFIFTSITELFTIYIDLVFFLANLILYFQINYHLICFLINGLYLSEYSYFKLFFFYSILVEIINFIIYHVLIFPTLIEFFLSYQLNNNFYFEARIYEYLNFYKKMYINSFMQFQLLTIVFLLLSVAKNHYNERIFAKNRKNIYFICLIVATLLTPPDILSQIVFCFFLLNIFEIFIFWNLINKLYLTWKIVKTN